MNPGVAPVGVAPRRARSYLELGVSWAVLTLAAAQLYPGRAGPTGQELLLALALLVACWLVDSVNVPAGLDRAGRVLSLSGVNALLFPAAILLPPALFTAIAVGTELPAIPRRGWRRPLVNGAIRAIQMCAASITYRAMAPGIDISDVPADLAAVDIVGLVAAGLAMLVVGSVAVSWSVRASEGLLPEDIRLLEPREVVRNTPDVAIGALACVLLATEPAAIVLLVPLFLLQAKALRAHAAQLGGHRDAKTGLLTFDAFLDLARRELSRARRTQQPASLLMMDLDGLKGINTSHGHLAGDRLIATMAGVLRSTCRQEDLISRFGGDEFCLLLPGADLAGGTSAAERIRRNTEQVTVPDVEPPAPLRVSIGVTQVRDEDDLEAILARADGGLRAAKRAGGNRVHVVVPAHQ